MSFNSAFFFKLHVWPSLWDRISLPCILTYSILNPLCYYFSFWVFPLIIVLWSCFWYFVWNWKLKCWKYEARLVHVGSSLTCSKQWRDLLGGWMFVFVCVCIWTESTVCHPACSKMHLKELSVTRPWLTHSCHSVYTVWSDYCTDSPQL